MLFRSCLVGGICLVYAAFCIYLARIALRDESQKELKIPSAAIGIALCLSALSPVAPPVLRDIFFIFSPFFCAMAMINRQKVIWIGLGCLGLYNFSLLQSFDKAPPAEEIVFGQALKKAFEVEEIFNSFPSPPKLNLIIAGHAGSSLAFPLASSPLTSAHGRLDIPQGWNHIMTRLRPVYPVFYIFKRHKIFWYLGFKELKDWRDVLNRSDNHEFLAANLHSLVMHSQVLGYLDFMEPVRQKNKWTSLVGGFSYQEFSPSIYWFYSRLHKNRLEMELRSLRPEHSFFSSSYQEKLITALFEANQWEIGRALLYRLTGEGLNQPRYAHLFARLALGLGDFPGALHFAREAMKFDSKFKAILFESLHHWEAHYRGPPSFNFDPLIKLAQELYEDSGRSEMDWLWKSLEYQQKKLNSFSSETSGNPWNDPCGNCSNSKP